MTRIRRKIGMAALTLAAILAGCDAEPLETTIAAKNEAEVSTNRIDIPQSVRENIGISFVKAERRRIAKTLRAPGIFEHEASGRSEYHAPLAGRIELLVRRYDDVTKGQSLYRLDAPEWRKIQQELGEAELAGAYVGRRLSASQEHVTAVKNEIELLTARIVQLEELNKAGGGRASELAEARAALAKAKTELAQAEEDLAQSEMENLQLRSRANSRAPNVRFEQALRLASTWTGISEEQLLERVEGPSGQAPRWKSLDVIEVIALHDGRVETTEIATGGWVQEGNPVMAIADHRSLLFRARALQSDISLYRDGQQAKIAPPQGGTVQLQDAMEAELRVGMEADPRSRTIDLLLYPKQIASWARPGMAAFAEIVVDESTDEEVAIPLSCVISDGLEKVFFMRDRKDPDKAVRVPADLGLDDGRWVAIRSGLRAGDEIVLDGAYELRLTGAGRAAKGGHFHSDGAFHEAH
jgi:multidrug efflux pump subunit AcrA (membrane-fusion protein)